MGDMKDTAQRDWFAGQALAGILSNSHTIPCRDQGEPFEQFVAKLVDSAYQIAEAMVKQGRKLRQGNLRGVQGAPVG